MPSSHSHLYQIVNELNYWCILLCNNLKIIAASNNKNLFITHKFISWLRDLIPPVCHPPPRIGMNWSTFFSQWWQRHKNTKCKHVRPLGAYTQNRTLFLPPHLIGQASNMAKLKVKGGLDFIHPWQSHNKTVDAGRGEELRLIIQFTTRGQLTPSGCISPTISATSPRRIHVSYNPSFFNFDCLVNES